MALLLIVYLALIIFIIAGIWKTFEKAGQPGWACIVPFYNYYIMAQIGGVKNWWLIFIPLVNIYIIIVILHGVSKSFGKDAGFTVGLVLLGFIFWPILGFGDAKYIGPNGVNEMKSDIDAIGK
jgi:hypothetical protein